MATTEIITVQRRRKYHWPEAQLNFWLVIMIIASSVILGIFAYLTAIQNTLKLGIPWILPYMITISSLAIIFIIIMLGLISQRQLLPGVVVLGSFILFVLWLTGLIETSIQLYGPSGAVNSYCGSRPNTNMINSQQTAVWLANNALCTDWRAAFAFEIVGTVFLLWMMVMAYQVNRDDFD
ncbi:MAG: hypothetical protein LQ343_002240 [Gyalolechia ehrenbergii]|nr:MAG: hypothetical protein LQ343_002240 [Gyalolechia ehrenbergii]